MPLSGSFKRCHLFAQSSLTFTEPDFCQLPDGGAAGAAVSVGLCVDPCEEVVGQRGHYLHHATSIPGNTLAVQIVRPDCSYSTRPGFRTRAKATTTR